LHRHQRPLAISGHNDINVAARSIERPPIEPHMYPQLPGLSFSPAPRRSPRRA